MKKNRNVGVELLRVLLMLGICGIHVAAFMGGGWKYLGMTLWPCVVGFVFISGYYGVRFSIKKLAALCGTGAWCAFVAALLSIGVLHSGGGGGIYEVAFANYKCYWFLHAYTFMMFFAPIIDAALTRENALKLGGPILFLVFGWSFAYSFNAARSFVVGLNGFGAMSGLTLVGIYVFARIFRLLEWEKKISAWVAVGVLVVTLPLTAIRFGTYDSPVALLVAAALFSLASRWRIEDGFVTKVITYLTPSLFAIYLLQVNSFVWQVYPIIVKSAISLGIPQIALFPLMTFGLFVTCLILDQIRRVMVRYAF